MENTKKKLRLEDIKVESFVIEGVISITGGATGGVPGCVGPDNTKPDCNSHAKSYCPHSCACFIDE